MNEAEAIQLLRHFAHTEFPKQCNCCGESYDTFPDFICNTRLIGKPVAFGDDIDDDPSILPFTAIGMVNCVCGTTIGISTQKLDTATKIKLLKWAQEETKKRGCSMSDFMDDLREKVVAIEIGETE